MYREKHCLSIVCAIHVKCITEQVVDYRHSEVNTGRGQTATFFPLFLSSCTFSVQIPSHGDPSNYHHCALHLPSCVSWSTLVWHCCCRCRLQCSGKVLVHFISQVVVEGLHMALLHLCSVDKLRLLLLHSNFLQVRQGNATKWLLMSSIYTEEALHQL